MKHELDYFYVDGRFGGRQAWFWDLSMRLAGCAALAACDSCISMAGAQQHYKLCPYDPKRLHKKEYKAFAHRMKPYLAPRIGGIDRLEVFVEGLQRYFHDVGDESVQMIPFAGTKSVEAAARVIRDQIDRGFVVPYLMLRHRDKKAMYCYIWHWFMITGYDNAPDGFKVKATTYGSWQWMDLAEMWDTGHDRKGGLILYSISNT